MRRLAFDQRISLAAAREMICRMAVYGDGLFRVQSRRDVQGLFAALGGSLDMAAAACLEFHKSRVPIFENLLTSQWQVVAGSVAVVDNETDAEIERISESGWIYTSTYQNGFAYAVQLLHRAVEHSDPNAITSAIIHGVTALDAFFLDPARRWNSEHPLDPLTDNRKHPTSFERKLREWMPKMSGRAFPQDENIWRNFEYLRLIRHDVGIHPKSSAGATTLTELAKRVNAFRAGIAEFLFQLHVHCRLAVSAMVIRACFAPDCVVIEVQDEKHDDPHG